MKDCNCLHLLGSLAEYLDEGAALELCSEIESHLAECPECRVVVDTMKKTITLVHAAPKPTLPETAKERLYKVLHLESYLDSTKRKP